MSDNSPVREVVLSCCCQVPHRIPRVLGSLFPPNDSVRLEPGEECLRPIVWADVLFDIAEMLRTVLVQVHRDLHRCCQSPFQGYPPRPYIVPYDLPLSEAS